MNTGELTHEILKTFGLEPTVEQRGAVEAFARFMFMPIAESAMLMCGSAGTGKTSLASAMVRTLHRLGQKIVLLAPTGRAAKVFSLNSSFPAHTIHRKIYRQRTFSGMDTAFNLADNLHKNTLFVVDEASMIANQSQSVDGRFGSGCLLDDLIRYVYNGQNCHLMFIGDRAQLPPVGSEESPALDSGVLEGYGLTVVSANMDEVLRQSEGSGILYNATTIRQMITHDEMTQLPKIRFQDFADIHIIRGDELIEQLCTSYSHAGVDETIVVTRSNKAANIYNQGIRNMILGREEELTAGDRLMVVKNNYHWVAPKKSPEVGEASPSFLANGDTAIVQRVRNHQELYGFRFADVWLRFPDYDDYEVQLKLMLNSLASDSPSLSNAEQSQLFEGVLADYADIRLKTDRMKAVREDAYYNALQVKYAYAVTCHKAQGGQWEHVYIDQGYMTDEMLTPDYIHWLYTAFTRATGKLFLVNWPKEQVASPVGGANVEC